MHYPVDVTEVVSGLNNPVGIVFSDALLLIAELGEKRIACCDLTGKYFLNPEKMTVKQLRKALNDRKLLRQGDRSKKSELQKVLKRWIHEKSKSTTAEDVTQSSKVHVGSIRNKPSIKPTAIVFSSGKKNQICVAEITGEIHLMTVVTDGLSVTADLISSVSVGVHSLFGVACKIGVEFYVSSSADAGGLFPVNFQTGHCERVLSNGSASLKQIQGICSKSDGKVILVDRRANKIKEFDVVSKQVTNLTGSGHTGSRDGCDLTASFSQPTGVCCEKDSHLLFVADASSGRLRLITSVQALNKYLQNLWLFLSAFNPTGTTTRLGFDETVTRVQHYYAFQGLNFPDSRTRRNTICYYTELREDDTGRSH